MKPIDVAACLLTACMLGIPLAYADAATDTADSARQTEVARQGATVMPFDLARTTHYFDDTANGGIETVTANEPGDEQQIALIRAHLEHEAGQFARGNFSDPAAIHGHDMPGLAALASAGDKLQVAYKTLPAGASLTYTSRDAAVIAAIHEWFNAQRVDHAAHGRHPH